MTIAAVLEDLIVSGLCLGAQVARVGHAEVKTWSIGLDGAGRPIGDETLFPVYCAGKPLLALACADVVEAKRSTFDTPIGALLPEAAASDATLRDLLTHTAGLHRADSPGLKLHGRTGKQRLALDATSSADWDPARKAGYSEYIAWFLVAAALERWTRTTWGDLTSSLLTGSAPYADEVHCVLSADSFSRLHPSLGLNADLRSGRPVPMLSERGQTFACEPNPGYGCYASARGLAAVLHEALTGSRTTLAQAGGRLMGEPRRGRRWDEVMQRNVDTLPGLMVEMDQYGVSGATSSSVGHTGMMGLTTVLHERAIGATICCTFVGLIDGELSVEARRRPLLDALSEAPMSG